MRGFHNNSNSDPLTPLEKPQGLRKRSHLFQQTHSILSSLIRFTTIVYSLILSIYVYIYSTLKKDERLWLVLLCQVDVKEVLKKNLKFEKLIGKQKGFK
jgi:hypothetical protein